MTSLSPDDTSAVTLEQLEEYLARNTRDILPSILPDQHKTTPQFTAGSTGDAPPPAHVEGDSAPSPTSVTPGDDDDESDEDELDSGAEEDDEVEEEESEPGADTQSEPPASTESSELIEVSPGVHMTREAIQQALAARPSPAPAPVEEAAGEQTSAPPAAPLPVPSADELPAIPQELLDDPEMGPIVRLLQAQQQTLAEQQRQLAFVSDISVARAQEELQSRVTAGIHEFQAAKHLTEEQLIEVNRVAAALNVMPSLASGIDPITGETIERDPQRAAYRALEIAYWQMPQYRDAEVASQVTARAKDQRKKQKLAGISGGSGSVPRQTQVPADRRSRELAAVSELRELMSPGSEE